MVDGILQYIGFEHSIIRSVLLEVQIYCYSYDSHFRFDETIQNWVAKDRYKPNFLAHSSSMDPLSLGKGIWNVFNDSKVKS